jgi:hypothetical protein
MKCPKCSSTDTRVTCTNHFDGYTKRYCRCLDCNFKFRTVERYEYIELAPAKPGPPKGVSRTRNIARGTRHGAAIFTEKNIKDMRYLYESGITLDVIANQYGTSRGYVSKIVNRKAWAHLR